MQMKMNAVPVPRGDGFTLVETLVAIAMLAVLAVLATPSFFAWRVRDQVDARAKALVSTLVFARGEAVRRSARVTVCRIDSALHCLAAGKPCPAGTADWSCGWAVMSERAGRSSLLRVLPDLAAVSVTGTLTDVAFTPPAGQVIGSFRSFEFAPRSPSAATRGDRWRRCVRIAAGGRARVIEGTCGASS
ncbi:MAG: prepilin-type N-terminal cleavage/methylation domain-containing protein [Paraburkholderia sp.]|nr:MAG: prepilin-type N-terminal cleavage/methylation domain-containing protein [Paraburkholderia sp.]